MLAQKVRIHGGPLVTRPPYNILNFQSSLKVQKKETGEASPPPGIVDKEARPEKPMRVRPLIPSLLPFFALLSACDPEDKGGGSNPTDSADSGGPVEIGDRGACNPVDPGLCALPFPSSFYLTEDAERPSGRRVDFAPDSLPANVDGVPYDPSALNRKDGFPVLGAAMTLLPGATMSGAATWDNPARSLEADSPTLILDAETGEQMPHYAELERFTADPARRVLLLRPVRPLAYNRRYIVAIRNILGEDGAALPAPEGFATLRDGGNSRDPDLLRQVEAYETTIFPVLESAGVARASLQMAWDFHTTSAEGSLGPLVHMRDAAIGALPPEGPAYTLGTTEERDCEGLDRIARVVRGTFEVPLYLTQWEAGNESRLVWGEDGMPAQNGTATVPFTVQIPCSALAEPAPRPILQFGHGLFGDRSHGESTAVGRMVDQNGQLILAVDWTGMKAGDVNPVTLAIAQDASLFASLPERLHQGQLEALLAGELAVRGLSADPTFAVDGVPLIANDNLHFYGVSQGGILGTATFALSTRMERAIFSVPGIPFSMLLNRAAPFQPFFLMLNAKYDDPAEISTLIGTFQMLWDPTEGGGWAPLMQGEPLESHIPWAAPVPTTKHALIHLAKGDRSVTSLAGHVLARSLGATQVSPPVRSLWGIPEAEAPFTGSALQEFDYGYEEPTEGETPEPDDVGPHNEPFSSPVANRQFAHYLETGEVIAVCDGPCDPD